MVALGLLPYQPALKAYDILAGERHGQIGIPIDSVPADAIEAVQRLLIALHDPIDTGWVVLHTGSKLILSLITILESPYNVISGRGVLVATVEAIVPSHECEGDGDAQVGQIAVVGFHAGDLASGENVLHEGGSGVHGRNSKGRRDRHICGRYTDNGWVGGLFSANSGPL